MRLDDVVVGETYTVHVPGELPRSRYPLDPLDVASVAWRRRASLKRGLDFVLTVTEVSVGGEPWVAGLEFRTGPEARVELTDGQAAALGLPAGMGYTIWGPVEDAEGNRVELPDADPWVVPARWLRPLTEGG